MRLLQPRQRIFVLYRVVTSRVFWLLVVLGLCTAWFIDFEVRQAYWQTRLIVPYAESLTYEVVDGKASLALYPQQGPFDQRLGYARLPQFLSTLQKQGMVIDRQAEFSDPLGRYVLKGFNPPYIEKHQGGLRIQDCRAEEFYHYAYPERIYSTLDDVPNAVLNALLYIEDRELMQPDSPSQNPVINWTRLAKAVILKAGEAVDLNVPTIGGSTLATQIEKYRHSEDGITGSSVDKFKQMVSATVRAYQQGSDTLDVRKQLALAYLNTVPLAAAPGFGEVNSLGDGLFVWMGTDFDEINTLLKAPPGEGVKLKRQGELMRQVVALMIAHRRPSYYLYQDREGLNNLTSSYLRLIGKEKLIPEALMWAALEAPLTFRNFRQNPAVRIKNLDKGVGMIRNRLTGLLGTSLYDLDRMDLTVQTSLDDPLQKHITAYLENLSQEEVAASKGLVGQYLLKPGQAASIKYSFTLFERTDQGNLVRVQTDNTDNLFDINEGSKLELGSTAKFRVTTSYLAIIAEIYEAQRGKSPEALHEAWREADDNLTRWVVDELVRTPEITLPDLLEGALNRRYSASTAENFFTGGGVMHFSNFQTKDNARIATVKEAFRDSLNLPFVRMLRDMISYLSNRLWDDFRDIARDDKDPRRQAFLASFIEQESRQFLTRFWKKYVNLQPQDRQEVFLSGIRQTPDRLAAIHRYLYPASDYDAFVAFMQEQMPDHTLRDDRLERMYNQYGPGKFDLQDQGYIARVHPLELWVLAYLQQHSEPDLKHAIEISANERQLIYRWLFTRKAKNARDKRVRIALEVEAFGELSRRWRQLGYPFDHLVPSLATALGSSGDRPAALATLMGIVLNDGVRMPTKRLTQLQFAANTPYEVDISNKGPGGEQVLKPEVAQAMRGLLSEVTHNGTARRLVGAYLDSEGQPVATGGKTGTGDNRMVTVNGAGQRITSRALNRTATFVFYLGERHFGTLTAFVLGEDAADFKFTSALPVQVLKSMAPTLAPWVQGSQRCDLPLSSDSAAPLLLVEATASSDHGAH